MKEFALDMLNSKLAAMQLAHDEGKVNLEMYYHHFCEGYVAALYHSDLIGTRVRNLYLDTISGIFTGNVRYEKQ